MPPATRERNYQTEGIVLHRLDYGEADRILEIYTPGQGKLDVIAKGARKTQSRSGPYLDVCAWLTFDLARGRDLEVVRGITMVRSFPQLATDLNVYAHANYVAELVRILTEPAEPNRAVFDLLARTLTLLNDGIDAWTLTRHFELALLAALGYHPEFFTCVNCGEPIVEGPNVFSAALGGFLCPECRQSDPVAMPLSINAQKFLRLLVRQGLAGIARVSPSDAERQEIQTATTHYVRYIAERDVKSLAVMRDLANLQPPTERR